MVRLCIASVDPAKLSSQCVMCNRREFPLTVIDCTGINRVNDLIANPLSVQEATCLIYNCRKQVPDVSPEPYHGSITNSVRGYQTSASAMRNYETIPPSSGMFGGYAGFPPFSSRYGSYLPAASGSSAISPQASANPLMSVGGLIGGTSPLTNRQKLDGALPYAIVPSSYGSLFGSRKIKATLIPLFK